MNTLKGTYKSKFDNFSLKIECNNPDLSDQYTFIKVNADGNELTSFEKILQGGTPGSLHIWGNGIGLNHNTDFTLISITEAPVIGLIGNYIRIE